jgi:hypothetical protein
MRIALFGEESDGFQGAVTPSAARMTAVGLVRYRSMKN